MATNEDLSEQLTLTTKLAAQVERMAAAAEKVDASYQTQIDATTKLVNVINQINTSGVVQGIEVLNKTLTGMSDKMKDVGKTTESTFQKLGKKVEDTGKTIAQKFPKSVGIAVGALSGFKQGISNVIALGKGVVGFTESFVEGLASITASIFAIPFKMFEGLVDMAAKSAGGSNELMQALEDLRKEFGAFYAPTNKAIIDTTKSLKGFQDTGLSAWRVFGNMADRLKYIGELAKEMGGSFSKLRQEMEDNGGAILAYQKGLGILNEDMKGVTMRSVTMGKKTSDNMKDMTKYSYELGDAFKLDAKLISRDMSKALSDVKHFGGATVKQIAEASTYARKLGFELKDITGTLDQFDTFDTAAESAAKLSQAFGVNIDAFEMMKAQSPAEQLELLRKSFKAAGVDASNFDRASLKLAATTTGLSEDVVQSALSLKNQGMSLDQIKKKSGDAEKKTLTQAQAMAKLADAIERMVQSGGGLEGGFWDMFLKGIKNGIMSSKEFFGLMRNIQVSLRQVYMIGVKLGRELVNIFPGLKDILGGFRDFFKPGYFSGMFQNISNSVRRFLDPLSSDKGNIPKLFENLKDSIMTMFTVEGTAGRKILEGFKTMFKFLGDIAVKGIKFFSEQLRDGIKFVLDLLTGKRKLDLSAEGSAAQGGLGFLWSVIGPIVGALKDAWKILKDPLRDLLVTLGHKALEFVKEHKKVFEKIGLAIIAIVLGPTVTRSITGALTTSLIKSVLSGSAKSVIKKAASSLGAMGESVLGKEGMSAAGAVAGPAAIVAAAAAIGQGVETYTKEITSTMDRSSTALAAGATGLIDALTLGLLPKDFKVTIANALAEVSEALFSGISSFFGKSFGDSLKRYLGGTFEVLGNAWGLVKNLFTGDQASFEKSAGELGLSLLRFAVSALEFMFVQLPSWLTKMAVKVLALLSNVIIKLVTGVVEGIAGGIDAAFGTDLVSKIKDASDKIQAGISSASDAYAKEADKQADAIHAASKTLQDQYLRSDDDKAALAKKLAATNAELATNAAGGDSQGEQANAAMATISENIKSVKSIQEQMKDNFDLQGTMAAIQAQFADIHFDTIMPQDKINELDTAAKNIGTMYEPLKSINDGMKMLGDLQDNMSKLAAVLKGDTNNKSGMAGALMAVSEMVRQANELDKALSDGGVNKIDIKAKLERVARAVGLGGKASYTVNPSKEVQITVNMKVTMDVGTVEKVILQREGSILRDRINFATFSNPTEKATTEVPNNPDTPYVPAVAGGTQT